MSPYILDNFYLSLPDLCSLQPPVPETRSRVYSNLPGFPVVSDNLASTVQLQCTMLKLVPIFLQSYLAPGTRIL